MLFNKKMIIIVLTILSFNTSASADTLIQALERGKAYANLNLRFENVEQNNAKKDADALTLRTRFGYKTATINQFSFVIEFEDSRVVAGNNDYHDAIGNHPSYSTIADPETTELDQLYIQYKAQKFSSKIGRQVLTFDNHRFVGHVGWRQDRQTFDGLTATYSPIKSLILNYAFINQRNRIFAEQKDADSEDHLLNVSFKSDIGVLTGYGYLLEVDNNSTNAIDTWGIRFINSKKKSWNNLIYLLEFATQESQSSLMEYDADYFHGMLGTKFNGITGKLGYESLGSDNGSYGFSTPLATLHKFNGWSDQFLGTPKQGLEDMYVSISGKALGGKWVVVYHNFSADQSSDIIDDFGDEIDLSYSKNFGKSYFAGVKYAAYSAGDSASSKVDTDKLWLWAGVKF